MAKRHTPLSNTPAGGTTIRSDLELRLLRASVAISQSSPQAPALVRQALAVAERHGYVQTVLDTAPQLVDHVIADSPVPVPNSRRADHRRPQNAQTFADVGMEVGKYLDAHTRRTSYVRPSFGVELPGLFTCRSSPRHNASRLCLHRRPRKVTHDHRTRGNHPPKG
jgi:hypothetical protein